MKFKVGDRVRSINIIRDDYELGVILEIDEKGSVFPYLVEIKDDHDSHLWFMENDLELDQAYLNETKLKKVLGIE